MAYRVFIKKKIIDNNDMQIIKAIANQNKPIGKSDNQSMSHFSASGFRQNFRIGLCSKAISTTIIDITKLTRKENIKIIFII